MGRTDKDCLQFLKICGFWRWKPYVRLNTTGGVVIQGSTESLLVTVLSIQCRCGDFGYKKPTTKFLRSFCYGHVEVGEWYHLLYFMFNDKNGQSNAIGTF